MIFPSKKIERRNDIIYLAASLVVRALAHSHASEVKAQHGEAKLLKGFCRLVDHLVVHGPAKQRMRMAHHGRKRWARAVFANWHIPQERLKPAGRSG